MWGPSIVGFGRYRSKSESGSHEWDWPLTGFSPRKQYLTSYVMDGNQDSAELFDQLGKHKTSKACLYINKLSDVDLTVLEKLIEKSFAFVKASYQ
jgi:hypothetical protein